MIHLTLYGEICVFCWLCLYCGLSVNAELFKSLINQLHDVIFGNFSRFIDKVSAGYGHVINWCVRHRTAVAGMALGVFAATIIGLSPLVETEFMPSSDQGRITVQLELPAGTGQHVTRDLGHELFERFTGNIPEIVNCSFALGQADSDNSFAAMQTNGTHVVSYNINVGSMEDRERSVAEIATVVRGILADYPEFKKVRVTEGGQGGMGGASTVDVEIYGYDFGTTDMVAKELQAKMIESGAFAQVILSRDEYSPEYQVDFDREKLAVNGLNSTTAASFLSAAMNGSTMSYYREDGDEYNIRVRYAPEFRTSIEDIENIIIYNNAGRKLKFLNFFKLFPKHFGARKNICPFKHSGYFSGCKIRNFSSEKRACSTKGFNNCFFN